MAPGSARAEPLIPLRGGRCPELRRRGAGSAGGELQLFATFGMRPAGQSPGTEVTRTPLPPARRLPAFLPAGFHHHGASLSHSRAPPRGARLVPLLRFLLSHARPGHSFSDSILDEAPSHFYRGHRREGILPGPPLRNPPHSITPPPRSAEVPLSPGTPHAFPALH